jgi:hypothetical protein
VNGQLVDETSVPANLVDRALFLRLLALEEKKAVRLQYGLSLISLVVEPSGRTRLDEASLVGRSARVALDQIRATDVVGALSGNAIAILLIATEPNELRAIVRRVTNAIAAQLGTLGEVSWNAGAASYPRHAGNTTDLLYEVEALTVKARAEGTRRLCVPVS